jgi:lysophospholipase L1-like esterase
MKIDTDRWPWAKGFLAELKWRNMRSTLAVVAITLFVFGIGAEILLRSRCSFCTWTEKNGGSYQSPYQEPTDSNWYWLRAPNQVTSYKQPEFDDEIRTNSLGIRDIEHSFDKATNEFRIIGIGDSFTEGQGVAYGNTYLKALERNLNAAVAGVDFTVINAGVAGSDPFYGYKLLKDKLLKFKPDLVTLTLNSSDVGDIMVRGGNERFLDDGSVRYADPPRDEWLFARSQLYRFIKRKLLRYDWLGLSPSERALREEETIFKLITLLGNFYDLARREEFEFVIIVHPDYHEFKDERYNFDINKIDDSLKKDGIKLLNLLQYFESHGLLQPKFLDILFWQTDHHYNAYGHIIFAEAIEAYLREQGVISSE